jgi:putative hydrolase of HD superfamily
MTDDRCEFDPAKNGGATRASGCPNQAEIIVGAGGRWRVCTSCAALPYFDLLRKRVPITRPTVNPEWLPLAIARIALKFGQVGRATLHDDGTPESDTTHTVMLAMLGMEVAPRVGCDPGLTAQFAVVHDLPETYAGDTNTARGLTPEEAEAKGAREEAAAKRLASELGASSVMSMLRRYEAQKEPEARLIRYLDKVLPKLTHYLNGGLALRKLGITAEEAAQKHAQQGAQLAAEYPEMEEVRRLFVDACALVERGIETGAVVVTSR